MVINYIAHSLITKKAFETTIHDASLWIKLVQAGVSFKIINMIYSSVKACIIDISSMSLFECFDISTGVKQEEPLFPFVICFVCQ